jgi:hypothetical protein
MLDVGLRINKFKEWGRRGGRGTLVGKVVILGSTGFLLAIVSCKRNTSATGSSIISLKRSLCASTEDLFP